MDMDNNMPFIIGKIFNKTEYADSLLDGKIFINPLAVFGAGELWEPNKDGNNMKSKVFNKYRDDINEGLIRNIDSNNPKGSNQLITFYNDIGGIPREINSIGEIDSRFLTENVNSFSALFYDSQKGELCHLDDKIFQFTDRNNGKAIIIFDVKSFLQRIISTLSRAVGSSFWMSYGLVDYDYEIDDNAELDEFTKEKTYSYQQEFRIAINLQGGKIAIRKGKKDVVYDSHKGTLEINIGSIRDIAFTLSVKDYINYVFPRNYEWIKYTKPDMLCPFYPPFKTEISYMCPLMRTDSYVLIGSHAMFPAKRNTNTFTINRKRLLKTRSYMPANDDFFVSVLELYFYRSLDICKSKADHTMLEQMLTGFVCYMKALGIDKCAGINVQNVDEKLQLSYEDLNVHDSGLIGYVDYVEIPNNSAKLKPTDFAVLVTLSNQTSFEEYEYNGNRYVRVEISEDGKLPSGDEVKAGQVVWVEVSKVKFLIPEFE